jgi:hypothetical protein
VRDRLGAAGQEIDLKALGSCWRLICNEFSKRIDDSLPFYYWSSQHSRFREGEERSFDILPEGSVPRLQHLPVSRRESVGQFVAARSHLPARGSLTIRSKFHKGVSDLPPPPGHRSTGPEDDHWQ